MGTVFSFTGLFLYAMLIWRFRQHDDQSQRLLAQMEETRDAELRAAALAERQRLAREMHDVLAHSLSGLVVQLEGARLLALSDPADERLPATMTARISWPRAAWTKPARRSACSATTSSPGRRSWPCSPGRSRPTPAFRAITR